MNFKNVLKEISDRRSESYTTEADIKRIAEAMEDNNWEEVKKSRLYRLHGGEYCELLSVMHRLG